MLWTVASFEARRRLRQPSTQVYFGVYFLSGLLLVAASAGAFKGVNMGVIAGGRTMVNSPFALHTIIALTSYFGLQTTAAFVGQAIVQDFEHRAAPLLFTMPISKRDYLGGRFLGALFALLVVFASIGLGCFAGTLLPGVQKSMLGPNRAAAYLWPYVVSVLPNLVFSGAIFFSMAALTRKIRGAYAASVILLVGYLIASSLFDKIDSKTVGALLDPLGLNATYFTIEYWPVAEQNTRLVPLSGLVLYNRLLWLGVGAALLAFTYVRFRFEQPSEGGGERAATAATEAPPREVPRVTPGPIRWAKLLPSLTWLAFRETVKNVTFLVIVLAGVLTMILGARNMGQLFGTPTYPVTYAVLEITGGTFSLFLFAVLIYFSGELVWRERDARVALITDALPVPTALPFVSKLLALFMVEAGLMAVVMATGIGVQLAHGYTRFEFGLYVTELFGVRLVRLCLVCVLAMTVQSLVDNKYVGYAVMVGYYVAVAFLPRFGFEHHLYQYGTAPRVIYSDMNGYGHFARPIVAFDLYWAAAAVLLSVLAGLFWVRGEERGLRARLAIARARLTPPVSALAGAAAIGFAGMGAYIHHNTDVLNKFRSSLEREQLQAETERAYKPREREPSPRIESVTIACDVFPEERRFEASGRYRIQNRTTSPITRVLVRLPSEAVVHKLTVAGVEAATRTDAIHGYWDFDLAAPLAPGAEATLDFAVGYQIKGFPNEEGNGNRLVENGTFVDSDVFPHLGYAREAEIADDDLRRKHGLPPRPRMTDLDDPKGRSRNYATPDADFIDFDATVSTSPDQIAVAPGTLAREWMEGGRRHFHYTSPSKILGFWSILSARWATRRDRWKDVDIEIDYHPAHAYNVDRMIEGVKASLDYFTASFGPYQHKLVRILEFPRYQAFAQSFPNTIPYSERIGFIAKVDPASEEDIDFPFYVTAHEVAHQWWAHQVIGADVQGATLLSETLAQYSALMVMKKRYGEGKMKRFLRYELDRYLIGRSLEKKRELPLVRVENQPYIHYQKGSLAMYALQDAVGEENVNRALAKLVADWGFRGPPYPTSVELTSRLREATPEEKRYLVEDLFETITLYDNHAISATYAQSGQRYRVKLRLTAKKLRADELGAEREVPLDEPIDVGVLDEKGEAILVEKRRIKAGEQEVELAVDRKPAKAGIDPLNKLVDRSSDDNVTAVKRE
jgi:hypothetical protein